MDEFFPPRIEAMLPPFIQGAVRSNPPTETSNSLPPWIIGESPRLDAEPGSLPEQDFGPSNTWGNNAEPEFILYYYPHSFNSQKVLMTLFEKDIPFKSRLVNINLGQQFHDDYLAINSKAEVPALKDLEDGTIVVDSRVIMDYLEEKYGSTPRVRKLIPEVEPWKSKHEEYLSKLQCLRIDAITFGSAYFGKFYNLTPHYPYTPVRLQLQEIALQRVNVLRQHAQRLQESNPDASLNLLNKATDAEQEGRAMRDIRSFERIIVQFENILDDCEAQLEQNWSGQDHPDNWLICPFITQADILLGLILQRLWQLGFNDRLFSPNHPRPNLQKYLKKMRGVYSFSQSAPLESETNWWPWIIGIGGLGLLMTIDTFWRRT